MDEIKDKLINVKRLIQFWKKFRVGESYLQDRNKGEVLLRLVLFNPSERFF